MRTKQLFLILALLCAMVQGAWAQASRDEVYAMTNTTSANWTKLNACVRNLVRDTFRCTQHRRPGVRLPLPLQRRNKRK